MAVDAVKNVLVGRDSNLSISIEQIAQCCTVTILLSAISQQSFPFWFTFLSFDDPISRTCRPEFAATNPIANLDPFDLAQWDNWNRRITTMEYDFGSATFIIRWNE